jgi:EmrB/QacA subfamily drug resistance transporter
MDSSRRKLWTLVLCCTAQFMVILDVSIVNVALPSIHRDLHFAPNDLQWVVSAYTLAFAGFLLLGGRAADVLGRRPVFVAGLLLFGLASLAGGLASGQGMLIAARGAQGLGGAIVAPATLSILSATFRQGPERNRALGAWGAMGGAGGAAGALLGGLLTETLSWRWILFINVPIGLVAAFAAVRLVAADRQADRARRDFDFLGAFTVTGGLVAIVFAIVRTDAVGWGSVQTIGVLALGLALLAAFLAIESRFARAPLMPLSIFRSRQLSGANVVIFMLGSAAFAMWYFVSLYLQEVLGFSPIEAGLAFLPMTLTIVAGSTLAGRLTARLGAGPLLAAGMGLIAVGMLLFARVAVNGHYLADVLAPSVLTAAGIGMSFVPVTIAAVAGVAARESGLASGLVNTSRQVGGSLGLAVLATIATQRTTSLLSHEGTRAALTGGFHRAFLVGAGFAAVGSLAALVLVPRVRGQLRRGPERQPEQTEPERAAA